MSRLSHRDASPHVVKQRYEVRSGFVGNHTGITSFTIRSCGTGLPFIDSKKCVWETRLGKNILQPTIHLQPRTCSQQYTHLDAAKAACERLITSGRDCLGVTQHGGFQCLRDEPPTDDINSASPAAAASSAPRLRAAIGLFGLLRVPCVVPMLLRAIHPRDDLFIQANYERYPQNARAGDFGHRRVDLAPFQPLFDRAVSLEVHDEILQDFDPDSAYSIAYRLSSCTAMAIRKSCRISQGRCLTTRRTTTTAGPSSC